MQVPSSSWMNPAAHSQQGLSSQRATSSTSSTQASSGVNQLEQSTKSGDRDASERYEGPMGGEQRQNGEKPVEESHAHDILELPADDGTTHSLDVLG
jgi:hypothetical protein